MVNACECTHLITLGVRTNKAKDVFTAKKLDISQGSALKIDKLLRREMVNAESIIEKGMEGREGAERIAMNEMKEEAGTIDKNVVERENITNTGAIVLALPLIRVLAPVHTLLTTGDAGTVLSLVRWATNEIVTTADTGKAEMGIAATMRTVVNHVVLRLAVDSTIPIRDRVLVLRGDDVWLNNY